MYVAHVGRHSVAGHTLATCSGFLESKISSGIRPRPRWEKPEYNNISPNDLSLGSMKLNGTWEISRPRALTIAPKTPALLQTQDFAYRVFMQFSSFRPGMWSIPISTLPRGSRVRSTNARDSTFRPSSSERHRLISFTFREHLCVVVAVHARSLDFPPSGTSLTRRNPPAG